MGDEQVLTLHDRLLSTKISDERIEKHRAAGRILLDGESVTDLTTPAPKPSRILIGPS